MIFASNEIDTSQYPVNKAKWEKLFIVSCFLPLVFYPIVDASSWKSSSDVHTLLEFTSSLVAMTAGVMVLLHFLTTGRWFFLFISIGFVQISGEEFVHSIFSFDRIWPGIFPTIKWAITTTWLAGRFTLLIAFIVAIIFGKHEIASKKRVPYAIFFNSIGFICSTLIALTIFNIGTLPGFVRLGSLGKELIEFSLSMSYFVIFVLCCKIYAGQQTHSPLLLSIIGCLIFQVLVHLFFLNTQSFYDAHWDAAHLLKLLGYFFPIFGVWGETIETHRLAKVQLIKLEREMVVRKHVEEELTQYRGHLEELVDKRTSELQQALDTLRRTQDQLVQSEKLSALGSMVAGVSHELNTPLGNNKMAVSTLRDRMLQVRTKYNEGTLTRTQIAAFFDEGQEVVELANRAIERAVGLVATFKQVAVDQTSERRRKFDLATVVEETIATLRPSYKNDPWKFVIDVPPGIEMDSFPGPLEQIVVNMVLNSIRHGFDGRDHGCITIAAHCETEGKIPHKHVVLTFADDGIGIAHENLGRVFDPFFTTRLGQGGSGIGLNITHRIATTLLGGSIKVESELGSGTIFTLRMPIEAPSIC